MSVRRRPIRLSIDADSDLDSILLYTEQAFGSEQTRKYQIEIYKGLSQIEAFPEIGVAEFLHGRQMRVFAVHRHRVWYSIGDEYIEVAAITYFRSSQEAAPPD